MKKMLAVLLAALMISAMLAACQPDKENAEKSGSEATETVNDGSSGSGDKTATDADGNIISDSSGNSSSSSSKSDKSSSGSAGGSDGSSGSSGSGGSGNSGSSGSGGTKTAPTDENGEVLEEEIPVVIATIPDEDEMVELPNYLI